jgi:hypothetical protein
MWSMTCSPQSIDRSSDNRSVYAVYCVTLLIQSLMRSGPIRPILLCWRHLSSLFSHWEYPKSWPIEDRFVNSLVKGSRHVSRRNSTNTTYLRRTCIRVIREVSCELCEGLQNQYPSFGLCFGCLRYTPETQWFVRS